MNKNSWLRLVQILVGNILEWAYKNHNKLINDYKFKMYL